MRNELLVQLALWQVALPVALMLLNAVLPVASRAGLVLRSAAVIGVLYYTTLVGLWLFPPWWTPYALTGLQGIITLWQLRRLTARGSARSASITVESGLALAGLASATFLALPALQGRTPPQVAIDLDMPLGPGRYLVLSGGAAPQINSHFFTLDLPRAAALRGQSHALDIIGIDAAGFRASGISPADPAVYEIYGADVLAPCDGTVLVALDGIPDNAVPVMNRDAMAGNHVVLECDGLAVVLAHFIPDSLTVRADETVDAGTKLAEVGNSGNSGEPHLHLHVQKIAPSDRPLSGEPLWFTIDGDFPVRNTRFSVRR